jgi:hypothetical protein
VARKQYARTQKSKKSKKFNPLVVVLSPRKIKAVRDAIDTLPYDRLWIKHYPAHEAYPLMDDEFEKRKEYTHLIPIPDDLVVPWEKLKILVKDITEDIPRELQDNCVVGGYCNIDTQLRQQISNVSLSCPTPERKPGERRTYASYKFLNMMGVQNLPPSYFTPFNPHLFETKFNGLTAWIIPRKVKEKFRFRQDCPDDVIENGCCRDVMACYDLSVLGIPIYTDRRVKLVHLRASEEADKTFVTNDPTYKEVRFEPRGMTPEEARKLDEKVAMERWEVLRQNSARVILRPDQVLDY